MPSVEAPAYAGQANKRAFDHYITIVLSCQELWCTINYCNYYVVANLLAQYRSLFRRRPAGPVGEALIMTGIGLAVALPAVMGYNWLTRSNRVLTTKLDAFAFELLNFLLIGRTLQAQGRGGRPGNVPLAAVNS